jgi:FkbM family methyltransferase
MLLKDFLVAQTAGAVAVSWVDGSPDTGNLPPLDGVEVRLDVVDALPVFLVRRVEIDQLIGRLGRRAEHSRVVVLTDAFLFEPAAQTLVTTFAAAGCQVLHAVEIDDAAEVDVFSAFALERRSTPLPNTGSSPPDVEAAGLVALGPFASEGEQSSADLLDRLRRLAKERDRARRDLRRAEGTLRDLRASTVMRVGRAAVDAIRVPRTGLPRLPERLLEAWRTRPAVRATHDGPHKTAGSATGPEVAMLEFSLALPTPPAAGGRETPRELTFAVPTWLYVARVLQRDGLRAFEPDMLPWFLALCETARPGAVWDVGANIGIYGLLARAYTEREVVGFEPTPEVAAWGRRIASHNDLAYRLEQLAAGAAAGTALLYLSDRTDSSNSLAAGFRPSSRRIEVLVETLDRYQELTNSSPAIVKIDTETTEHLVLRGARRVLTEHRPWIFCEVLVNREPARVLTHLMSGTGYRYYQLTGDRVPAERQTITGDPSNPHPNYLLAPVEPGPDFLASADRWRRALAACRAQPAGRGRRRTP